MRHLLSVPAGGRTGLGDGAEAPPVCWALRGTHVDLVCGFCLPTRSEGGRAPSATVTGRLCWSCFHLEGGRGGRGVGSEPITEPGLQGGRVLLLTPPHCRGGQRGAETDGAEVDGGGRRWTEQAASAGAAGQGAGWGPWPGVDPPGQAHWSLGHFGLSPRGLLTWRERSPGPQGRGTASRAGGAPGQRPGVCAYLS